MNDTKNLQEALKRDLKNILNLKFEEVEPRSFYLPLLKEWVRYFIVLCVSNVVVVYGLTYTSSFYIRGVHRLARDIILPNFIFAVVLVFFLSQFHIFKILAKNRLQSLPHIQKVINRFELIFFGLYVLFYAFTLQTEGDIAGTIMGAAVSGFVCACLTMALVVMFESQRVALPVITDLISQFNDKHKRDPFLSSEDNE